jgi:hypothetical protein
MEEETKAKFRHSCTGCVYIGTATVNNVTCDYYTHARECREHDDIVCRYGDKPNEYSGIYPSIVSAISMTSLVGFSLYLQYHKVKGCMNGAIHGEFYDIDNKLIIKL